MSTKSTFVLTENNEHIYHDCMDQTITFEFNLDHIKFHEDKDSITIDVKPGSDLYKQLSSILWTSGWCGSEPKVK